MCVKVDADARPVEPRGHLFNMRGFAGAVIALHHHPAIVGKARTNRERGIRIKDIVRVKIGNAFIGLAEFGHHHVRINPERLAHADHLIRRFKHRIGAAVGLDIGNVSHGLLFPLA